MVISTHNAGVEGSSPSLSTKIKQLDLSPDPHVPVCRFFCDEGQHQSVLTERPTDTRPPMDPAVLWYALALGAAVLVGVAVWTWLDRGNK